LNKEKLEKRKRETLRAWRPKEVVAKEETKSESLSHSRTLRLSWWMEADATTTVCVSLCVCRLCLSLLLMGKENMIVLQLQDNIFIVCVLEIAQSYG
jgi:hypothetical protein